MCCCNKLTLFTLFFCLLIWIVVVILSSNLPFSKLYYFTDDNDVFLSRFGVYRNSSHKAIRDMKAWLEKKKRNQLLFSKPNDDVSPFCVGVITKERKGLNTIYESIASLLTRIQLKHESSVDITVFNVDDDTKHASLMNLTDLVKIENVQNAFGSLLFQLAYFPKIKEAADYAAVMKRLFDKNCKYALVVEDDAIATINWYEKTIEAIEKLTSKYGHDGDKWLCLKLFTSFQSFDWVSSGSTIFKTFIYIILFTIIQSLVLSYMFSLKNNSSTKTNVISLPFHSSTLNVESSGGGSSRRIGRSLPRKVLIILFFNSVFLNFYINNNSVSPIGTGVKSLSQGYNTVAIVYPRSQLKSLSTYLENHVRAYMVKDVPKFYPKDLLINIYRKEHKIDEFIAEPSIFQHIGVYSSLGNRGSNNFIEFQYGPFESYSFEAFSKPIDFDPEFWRIK